MSESKRTIKRTWQWFLSECHRMMFLPDNLEKDSWRDCSLDFLEASIRENLRTLRKSRIELEFYTPESDMTKKDLRDVIIKCTCDIANFSMMIADDVRGLSKQQNKN